MKARTWPAYIFVFLVHALFFTTAAYAQDIETLNSGDTAWMLTSSLLVLMMSTPGLALFYGGLVKKNNVLATLMQTIAIVAIVSVLWPVIGYTLAFSEGSPFIGGLSNMFLNNVTPDSMTGTFPETIFIMFQMTFAAITTALLVGSVADRIKFSTVVLLAPLWMVLVYCPVAHWVWGPGGFLGGVGVDDFEGVLGYGAALDFAGGTVVHINSGIAGLVAALVIGRGRDYQHRQSTSTNLIMSVIGTGLLWVGWFGFNAGSALTAGTGAGMSMLMTNTAAGAGCMMWMAAEWIKSGKPSVVGALSGVVSGLVAITPAAGFVGLPAALMIGFAAGLICFLSVTYLKHALKYDDSLDVFGIHGIGGIVGAILAGVYAQSSIGGVPGWYYDGHFDQVMAQIIAVVVTMIYSGVMTFALLKALRFVTGLRVRPSIEKFGLDIHLHGESMENW